MKSNIVIIQPKNRQKTKKHTIQTIETMMKQQLSSISSTSRMQLHQDIGRVGLEPLLNQRLKVF
jgi:hypothetical protein